jgi:hypothetical protein
MITIMNLRNTKPSQPYDFRIDRASVLGNPYIMRNESERDEVCLWYEKTFHNAMLLNEDVRKKLNEILEAYQLHGQVRLFCWCAPKRCHGGTIKKWLDGNQSERMNRDRD